MDSINDVIQFNQQQLGFANWRKSNSKLIRFTCKKEDDYNGITGVNRPAVETPILACKFAPHTGQEHILAMANEEGKLVLHNTKPSSKAGRTVLGIHQNSIFDIAWLSHAFKLLTVSGDHTARMVDIGEGRSTVEQIFAGHSRSVKTVAVMPSEPRIFATGSRDGSAIIWDIRCQATRLPYNPEKTSRNFATTIVAGNSVTALAFQNDNTLISTCAIDGNLKFWDLRRSYSHDRYLPKNVIPYAGTSTKKGFSNLLVDKSTITLYANCLDNKIYSYNISTVNPSPVMEYTGFSNKTFYIKSQLSPCGNYLFSGSSDEFAYIWDIKYKEPFVKLTGHTAEVTCVAWSDLTLATCSDDLTHKIWRIGPEVEPLDKAGEVKYIHTPVKRSIALVEGNENPPNLIVKKCKFWSAKRILEMDEIIPKRLKLIDNRKLLQPIEIRTEEKAITTEKYWLRSPSKKIKNDELDTRSPTTNLPNFVIDGVAPHVNISPLKKPDNDWLTKMRMEKHQAVDDPDGAPSPKVPRLDSPHRARTPNRTTATPRRTPNSRNTPRRNTPSRTASGSKTPQSHLLQFFRVTNNNIMKDVKGPSCHNVMSNGVTGSLQPEKICKNN